MDIKKEIEKIYLACNESRVWEIQDKLGNLLKRIEKSSKPQAPAISLCSKCNCMTKTIKGKCGKCNADKPRPPDSNSKDCSNCIHSKVCSYNIDKDNHGLCEDYLSSPS